MFRSAKYLLAAGLFLPAFLLNAQEPEVLRAAVVVADPPLVKTVGDTVVFNPDALALEEDAMLEDILRKIPGMDVENGVVTLYGRKVEKLLVEGRLYFGGDILTGLKNLQGDLVESIKAYVRPSDFARISGVDDGEEETVLDVRIKKRFLGSWKGRIQGGGSYPLRYLAAGNAGVLSDTVHASVLANFRNTPAIQKITSTRPTRLGSGSDGDRDRREAGVDYSKNGKKLELDASVKYSGDNYLRQRSGWAQNFYVKSRNFSLSDAPETGYTHNVRAQADLEWKPSRAWTFLFKPDFSLQETDSFSAPISQTYSTDPREDEAAVALNKVYQENDQNRKRLEGKTVLQATRRMNKKGRSASLRFNGSFATGENNTRSHYDGLTFKNGKTTVRDYHILNPWTRSDLTLQGSWNEPLGKGFHLQLLVSGRYWTHQADRNYFFPDSGVPDPEFTSNGSFSAVQLTAQASLRFVRKKFNLNAGIALKPVWSFVHYHTADVADGFQRGSQFYAAPTLNLRYNKSKTEYLSLRYISYASMPSPETMIPIRSGTNPLYVREGNPFVKPSFTHRINLSYNYSQPQKGSSLVTEVEARVVQNAFATTTEYIPETGGRIIRSCNIDGTWNVNGSCVFNHSFKGLPLSLSNHLEGSFAQSATNLYNSSTKGDERSLLRRGAVRERLDATLRWKRFSFTLTAGGEYTLERSLLFPNLNFSPYGLFCGGDAALRLPFRWRIATDFGFYASRGHGLKELEQDLWMWNASVSKSFLDGNLTLRLSGNNLLDQQSHLAYQATASARRFNSYNGFGRNVLLTLIWRFGKK